MKTFQLSDGISFDESGAKAQPLHVDAHGRVLRFALRPGQAVKEHNAPHSPVNIVVLQGHGMFSGGDGQEKLIGPSTLLVINPGESHSIRALAEDLVFLVILHAAPGAA